MGITLCRFQVILGLLAFLFARNGLAQISSDQASDSRNVSPRQSLGSNVAHYVENRGQLSDQFSHAIPEVKYYYDALGVRLYVAQSSAGQASLHFVFSKNVSHSTRSLYDSETGTDTINKSELYRTDLFFPGSNSKAWIDASDTQSSYDNFYLPRYPNGLTHVPEFGRVTYHDLYPNIDLILITDHGLTKTQFLVRPGGDPSRIRLQYDARERISLKDNGSLWVVNDFGVLSEPKPVSYCSGKSIETSFQLRRNEIGFQIDGYDTTHELLIDPPRVWGTYYGGGSADEFRGVATDPSGNIYAAGITTSTNGIATSGAFQTSIPGNGNSAAMLVKFSSTGIRQWGTYIGGSNGDVARAVAVDHNGDILICGWAKTTSGISTSGAYQTNQSYPGYEDVFLMKFSNAGARIWGTYYGTSNRDLGFGLGVDASNNVYVGGTWAGYPNFGNAFVAKFNSTGSSLLWSTNFNSNGNGDVVYAITVDKSGNVYATGQTSTTSGFATTGAHQTTLGGGIFNAFVAKLNTSGTIQWCSYYGGNNFDAGFGIAVDTGGNNIYVSGEAGSATNISTSGSLQPSRGSPGPNAFLSDWTSAGVLSWGTYYGAAGSDFSYGVTVDRDQNAIMTGATYSSTNIATSGEYQTSLQGTNYNSFLAKFNSSGNRQWGTYYASGNYEYGQAIAIDSNNYIILGGITSDHTGVMATSGAQQTSSGGGDDAFLAKFCNVMVPTILNSGSDSICQGSSVVLTVPTGYSSYQWKLSGVNLSGATANTYTVPATLTPANYDYSVSVTNATGCSTISLTKTLIVSANPVTSAGVNRTICSGDATTLGGTTTGGKTPYSYSWTPSTGLSATNISSPVATPNTTTTYTVIVTDANGCQNAQNVTVTVNPVPVLALTHQVETCSNAPVQIGGVASGATAPYSYSWYPLSNLSSAFVAQPTASPTATTKYFDTVTDAHGCRVVDSVLITVNPAPILGLASSTSICSGASTVLSPAVTNGTGPMSYNWTPSTGLSGVSVANPVASPGTTTTYQVTVTDSKGCTVSGRETVIVNAIPVPAINPPGPISICQDDSVILTSVNSYPVYRWSTGDATSSITVKQAGAYSLFVADANGCDSTSGVITVTVHARPLASLSGPSSVCPGESSSYAAALITGATYNWKVSGGGTITSGASSANCGITWSTVGTWQLTLTVTDTATGCSKDSVIAVAVSSSLTPSISLSGSTTLCTGDSLILSAPSGYKSYKWSDGESSQQIVVKQSGSYYVNVTSSGGCTGSSLPVKVTAVNVPKPTPVIIASASTLCDGDTAVLVVDAGFSSYLWPDGSKKDSLYVTKSGSYAVTVTNSSGCQATSLPITVTVLPSPVVAVTPNGPTSFCEGDSVTLSATPGFADYVWTNGSQGSSLVVKASGSYAVTVQSANGCSRRSASIPITVNPVPTPIVSGPITVCAGSRSTYTIKDVAGSSANWLVAGGTIASGQGTATLVVQWGAQGTGTIDVKQTVTSSGCEGIAQRLNVTVGSSLKPQVSSNGKTVLCGAGDSVVLDAGSGYANYLWTTGEKTETTVVRTPGTYKVTVDDGAGCSGSSDDVVISSGSVPSPSIVPAGPITLCQGDQDTLHAGIGYATYAWLKDGTLIAGEVTERLIATATGDYSAIVMNNEGCNGTSAPVRVTVNPLPSRPIVTETNGILSSSSANSYQWSLDGKAIIGATTQTYTPSSIGSYTVTISDVNGCTNTSLPFAVSSGGSTIIGLPSMVFAQAMDHVVLPMNIVSSQNLQPGVNRDFKLWLRFNRTLLLPDDPYTVLKQQGDDLTVALSGTTGQTQGVIKNIGFTALLGDDSCTLVSIDSFAWTSPNIAVTRVNGTFCLSGLCEQGGTRLINPNGTFSLSEPRPNPVFGQVQIGYELIEHGQTVLSITDLLGREVLQLVNADQQPGRYAVVTDLRSLVAGRYFYSLRTPSQCLTKRLTIVQ